MTIFDAMDGHGHEEVVFCRDDAAGYRSIIALHSTALGPAFGGTRYWNYADEDAALRDVFRLSRGMTYKNAAAGLPFGGGKTVILARDGVDRERLYRVHGRFVERLGGRYVTAQDVGTTLADLDQVARETKHVAGLAGRLEGGVSVHTGRGVFRALQAAAQRSFGTDDLAGRTVAVQGCGAVGTHLLRQLRAAGAKLVVSDVDRGRAESAVREHGAVAVEPESIYDVEAELFAPCALGGILNDATIPRLRCAAVVGGANNQLLEERHARALADRGILYGPDYVANAGGVIGGTVELLGWPVERMRAKVDAIYDTMLEVFAIAERERILPHEAADRLAERRIAEGAKSRLSESTA